MAVGLPATPPTGEPPSDSPWTILGPIAVLIAVIAVALGLVVLMRRQRPPQPA